MVSNVDINNDDTDADEEDEDEEEEQLEMEESEQRVLNAAKHVQRAKGQRELFNKKKQQAKEDRDKPRADRVYCFVADFAQNINLPNFAEEQPGATYYFSPMSVYPFGIVDCSTEPSQLTAFCYYEGQAKKATASPQCCGNLFWLKDYSTAPAWQRR
jgi:hypothetical protein